MKLTGYGRSMAFASAFALAAVAVGATSNPPPSSAAQPPPRAALSPIPCVVRWHYDLALKPDWCSTPSPSPGTSASPVPKPAYGLPLVADAGFPQIETSPRPVHLVGTTDDGLRFEFDLHPTSPQPSPAATFHGRRLLDGVPFAAAPLPSASPSQDEDRIALTFAVAGDPGRSFTVYANPQYHCVVEGDGLTDEQVAACAAAQPTPTPSPSGSASPSPVPSPNPSATPRCGEGKPDFCGSLTVGTALLRSRLGIGRIPAGGSGMRQMLSICARLTRGPVPAGPAASAAAGDAACTQFALVHLNTYDDDRTYALAVGPVNRQSTTGGSPAPAAAATLRRGPRAAAASAGSATNGAQSGPDGGTFAFGGAMVKPYDTAVRFSLEVQNVDLPSSVTKQTKMLLDQLPQQLNLNRFANGIALNGDGTSIHLASPNPSASPFGSDSFTTADMAPFTRVVARPYRPRLEQDAVAKLAALEPFDPDTVKQFTLGQKLVWQTTDTFAGIGYFDDFDTDTWGAIAHVEHDAGHFSIGVSRIAANRPSRPAPSATPDNAYVTRPFSVNTVAGLGYRFGDPRWQTFLRYATAGTGRDQLATLSYADRSPGRLVGGTEDVLQARFLAGYRSIDDRYDPLGTVYSQYARTQSFFGALGTHRTHPQVDRDPYETDLVVEAARAHDYRAPRYSLFETTASIPIGVDKKPNFSLTLAWTRSSIAPSVVTRASGTFVWNDPPGGSTLLDNDAARFAVGYTNKHSNLTLSLGETFSHTPSCTQGAATAGGASGPPSCTSDYIPKPQGALSFAVNRFVFDGSSSVKAFQSTVASSDKSPAANHLVANAVLAWHIVCGRALDPKKPASQQGQPFDVEPYLTYTNNVSESNTTFTPGSLDELGVQFGWRSGNGALSFGYKVARDASGQPVPVQGHARTYGLVYGSDVLWKRLAKYDKCAAKPAS